MTAPALVAYATADGVATIAMDAPDTRNALSDELLDALLAALRAGKEPPVHARAGRRALELAHAIIRSAADGVRVGTSGS